MTWVKVSITYLHMYRYNYVKKHYFNFQSLKIYVSVLGFIFNKMWDVDFTALMRMASRPDPGWWISSCKPCKLRVTSPLIWTENVGKHEKSPFSLLLLCYCNWGLGTKMKKSTMTFSTYEFITFLNDYLNNFHTFWKPSKRPCYSLMSAVGFDFFFPPYFTNKF